MWSHNILCLLMIKRGTFINLLSHLWCGFLNWRLHRGCSFLLMIVPTKDRERSTTQLYVASVPQCLSGITTVNLKKHIMFSNRLTNQMLLLHILVNHLNTADLIKGDLQS